MILYFNFVKMSLKLVVAKCDIKLGEASESCLMQGIAMFNSVLESKTAVEVNICIMNAFVSMRRFIATNTQLFQWLEFIEYRQLPFSRQSNGGNAHLEHPTIGLWKRVERYVRRLLILIYFSE